MDMMVPHKTWPTYTAMLYEQAYALPPSDGRDVALRLVDAVRHAEISYANIAAEVKRLRELLGEFVTEPSGGYVSNDDEDYCQYCFERSVHRLYETPLYPHTPDCLVNRARAALDQATP